MSVFRALGRVFCLVGTIGLLATYAGAADPAGSKGKTRAPFTRPTRSLRPAEIGQSLGGFFQALTSRSTTQTNVSLQNFGFDSGDLSGWVAAGPVSVVQLGSSPPAALLEEEESLRDGTILRQTFEFPGGNETVMSFAFAMVLDGVGSDPFPPDAFLVSVLDPLTLMPVASNGAYSELFAVEFDNSSGAFVLNYAPAMVSVEDLAQFALPEFHGVGGVVTMQVPPTALQHGLLEFRLAGGFDGFHASVVVDCIDAACRCENDSCDPGETPCTCPAGCGASPPAELVSVSCTDGIDNDCDGAADCADSDCASEAVCVCNNNVCDPGETPCTCPAGCGAPPATELPDQTCGDGIDNDCDGVADCSDPNCSSDQACRCQDAVCDPGENPCTCPAGCGAPPSQEKANQTCGNKLDDDCDGMADCADLDCASDSVCRCSDATCDPDEDSCRCPLSCGPPPESEGGACNDARDNDCDELIDCQDSDCASDSTCQAGPNCSMAVAEPAQLWPPNHKFRAIQIGGVSNPSGGAVSILVTGIFQDEPLTGGGSGNTAPDGMGIGTDTARVRAERAGDPDVPGNGRVYHVRFTASHAQNQQCSGEVQVCVPHDQDGGGQCVDDGSLYESAVPE